MYKVVSGIHNLGNIHVFLPLAQKIRNQMPAVAEYQTSSIEVEVCVFFSQLEAPKKSFLDSLQALLTWHRLVQHC